MYRFVAYSNIHEEKHKYLNKVAYFNFYEVECQNV